MRLKKKVNYKSRKRRVKCKKWKRLSYDGQNCFEKYVDWIEDKTIINTKRNKKDIGESK